MSLMTRKKRLLLLLLLHRELNESILRLKTTSRSTRLAPTLPGWLDEWFNLKIIAQDLWCTPSSIAKLDSKRRRTKRTPLGRLPLTWGPPVALLHPLRLHGALTPSNPWFLLSHTGTVRTMSVLLLMNILEVVIPLTWVRRLVAHVQPILIIRLLPLCRKETMSTPRRPSSLQCTRRRVHTAS